MARSEERGGSSRWVRLKGVRENVCVLCGRPIKGEDYALIGGSNRRAHMKCATTYCYSILEG